MLCYFRYVLLFLTLNLFADLNFTNPVTVTGSAPPNLSQDGGNANIYVLKTDSSGQYVYPIWVRQDASGNDIIQAVRSENYGETWLNPLTVTGSAPPNLSQDGKNATSADITTSADGNYVYAIWRRQNASNKYIVQFVRSENHGDTWVNPLTVTGSAPPNLSQDGQDAGSIPGVATSANGKYVYAIWARYNGTNYIIQTVRSEDYGKNWVNPLTVTGSAPPNLSQDGRSATEPIIVTDASGQYVYAMWRRHNGTNYIIQTVRSEDYGKNWSNPITVTGSASPNLSQDGRETTAFFLDSSGQYVYAAWGRKNDGTNYIIQTVRSEDYGKNWSNPITVTGSAPPNLSQDGKTTGAMRLKASSDGSAVYVVWAIQNDGSNYMAQLARSTDYGKNWSYPTTVTGDVPPNLSQTGGTSPVVFVTANETGQHVYVVWIRRNVSGNYIVQAVRSIDYGDTWSNPTTVTGSISPNLSQDGRDAFIYKTITADASGRHVYVAWRRNNNGDGKYIIQAVNGINTDVVTTLVELFGSQIKIRFPFQIELTNKLSWNSISEAVSYRIYSDANLTNLIAEIQSPNLNFTDHRIKFGAYKTYYVTWVSGTGSESLASQITLP